MKEIAFTLIFIAILGVSLDSIRAPFKHGFYRFFAFVSILGLLYINLEAWFVDPLSLHQLVSWFLLLCSLLLILYGVIYLKVIGKPQEGIEDTTVLVEVGIYHYIRHPLYSSLLMLGWGVFFKLPGWGGLFLAAAQTVFLVLTAKVEERENLEKFGEEYQAYIGRSKMFLPFIV